MEVGIVLHKAKSGRLIVKLSREIEIGDILLDEKGKRVGKVVELIGSVNAPYASVIPLTDRIKGSIGKKVYILMKR
ncbi:MAG: Gar1/Naf1 family protein [Candidatus Nitrosocaldaceae archaeon]